MLPLSNPAPEDQICLTTGFVKIDHFALNV